MKEAPVKHGDVLADKYVVESVLGVGGMGVVVEAVHLELHEARAIKLMLPDALEDKEAVERFLREARRSSRLKSEHVVRVHDVDKLASGAPYMVMELLQGSDLRTLIKERGRLPVGEAVHYALQACEALAEAHSMGIIHRDLKPANLFLTRRNDGTPCVKVLDFGISRDLGSGDDELTKTQAVLGSPSYMSPEQMRSARAVDARTDIWSLGVILYRLVAGDLPFRADSMAGLVTKVLQSTPRPPSALVPELPPELDEVVLRCLERDLSMRYATVGELSAALLPFAPPEARASIDRIARVLAIASHGGGILPAITMGGPERSPQPPPGSMGADVTTAGPTSTSTGTLSPQPPSVRGTSGDAWAQTSLGGGTIAVSRWKLWGLVAAVAALLVSLLVTVVILKQSPTPDPVAAAPPVTVEARETPRPVAMGETPKPPARPAVTTAEVVTVAETARVAAPAITAPAAPTTASAIVLAKGPLPGARRTASLPAPASKTADPAPTAPPAATPAPPPTAAHRVFGSEN